MKQTDYNERVALFAGSFDPYTKGHHALVLRALGMFDKVVIAIGGNSDKNAMFTVDERLHTIGRLYADDCRVSVAAYDSLTADYAREVGACCLLRGVRSVKDFEYERDLADINRAIGGIETVILPSEPQYAAISSSVVRELIRYGKDVSNLLP